MACHHRIVIDSPNIRLGNPEVRLGLIPGAGGTQRLPRLVGRGRALDLILSGATIDASEAHRIGLVDHVVPADKLPASFRKIPANSEIGDVRASVAGTDEAIDAVMDAQIPQTATVKRVTPDLKVTYDGEPKWVAIHSTERSMKSPRRDDTSMFSSRWKASMRSDVYGFVHSSRAV